MPVMGVGLVAELMATLDFRHGLACEALVMVSDRA